MSYHNAIIVTEEPHRIAWFIEHTKLPLYTHTPPNASHVFEYLDGTMTLVTPHAKLVLNDSLPQDVHQHPLYKLVKKYAKPGGILVDATGGLGKDSLITLYASPNILITYERLPILAWALYYLSYKHRDRWIIKNADAMEHHDRANLWLIDPMFPPHPKTAQSQKRLQIIQSLVPPDDDFSSLVEHALSKADHVFLKQPQMKQPYGLWAKVSRDNAGS
jgi:hypothetical protein